MTKQSLTPVIRAQLEAESLIPTNVGGSDMVLTFEEPAAPGYRAHISDDDNSQVPANLETDEMRIAVFAPGSTEPSVYLAVRRREGLLNWHKESVGLCLDRPAPMPIAKLLGMVTSNAILQALRADIQREHEETAAPRPGDPTGLQRASSTGSLTAETAIKGRSFLPCRSLDGGVLSGLTSATTWTAQASMVSCRSRAAARRFPAPGAGSSTSAGRTQGLG